MSSGVLVKGIILKYNMTAGYYGEDFCISRQKLQGLFVYQDKNAVYLAPHLNDFDCFRCNHLLCLTRCI